MPDQPIGTDSASRLGRLEAEHFDGLLRDQERRELQERWSRSFPRESAAHATRTNYRSMDLQTADQFERLTHFHDAVLKSRVWRVLQMLRRPFGRQW